MPARVRSRQAGRMVALVEASTLVQVPSGRDLTWQEVTAANRERIRGLEHELERVRESLHDVRAEAQAIRYLAEKVADLAGDVRALAQRVETVSRRAVEKPTASALAVFGQYVGLIVAVVAIVIAASR